MRTLACLGIGRRGERARDAVQSHPAGPGHRPRAPAPPLCLSTRESCDSVCQRGIWPEKKPLPS